MLLVSIIIPFYNAEKTLKRCLFSIHYALRKNMEVILVDDASTDDSPRIAAEFPYQIIRIQEHNGPATCRNIGAEKAKAKYLLFIDADVILQKDTIEKLIGTYNERPDIVGVSAIYSDRPVAPGLFQEFKAIEQAYKYSNYTADRYSAFDTSCGSIRRDVFFKIGGFNTSYKNADTEDVEFGYNLSQRYINCINPNVTVDHIHANYLHGVYNYYSRSFYWTKLFLPRLKFDEVVTTKSNALSALIALSVTLTFFFSFWYKKLLWFSIAGLIIFILWNIRFFRIAVQKNCHSSLYKVWPFLFYLYTLQLSVSLGASVGLVYWSLFRQKNNKKGRKTSIYETSFKFREDY